jgi:hypothetical protein
LTLNGAIGSIGKKPYAFFVGGYMKKIKELWKHRKWKLYLYYNSIHIKTLKIDENTAPKEMVKPITVWFKKQLFANNKVGIIVRPVRIIKNDEKNKKTYWEVAIEQGVDVD